MQEVDAAARNTAPAPARQWIVALHVDLVGHPPDPRELARWITAGRRGATHREIASGVLQSDQYCRTQVTALYRSLLDRDPDPGGLEAWINALAAGLALQDVIAGFCDSFEYKTHHPVGPEFVESLYRRLASRASDADGKAAWLTALDQRSSTLSVIRRFLCSPEYCTLRVTELHERLLGYEPDKTDLRERVVALMQGVALQEVVLGFATSDAYISRASARRIPVSTPPARVRASARGTTPVPRPGQDPDDDVVDLVRGGDGKAALQRLMQRHGAAVYRYCRAALGDPALADDIHQQVFIEAFRDLPRFAGRSTVRTWLLGIARHRVLDAAKRRRRSRSHLDEKGAAEMPDPRPSPWESLDDARLQAATAVCVDELDEPARTSVLLRYQQGLSYEEMAVICGENPGTLQARVARALRRLRDLIEEHMS